MTLDDLLRDHADSLHKALQILQHVLFTSLVIFLFLHCGYCWRYLFRHISVNFLLAVFLLTVLCHCLFCFGFCFRLFLHHWLLWLLHDFILHDLDHLGADEVMITLRVIGDWESIVGEKLANDFLLAFCEASQLWTVNRYVKLQSNLVFRLADDLHKLLQSPCDVIGIRELAVLIVDLFSCVEAELAVEAHGLIVRIAILVGSDE